MKDEKIQYENQSKCKKNHSCNTSLSVNLLILSSVINLIKDIHIINFYYVLM